MIVGHGDIASVLGPVDRGDRIYFASGVSNSREAREEEFRREGDLLLSQRTDLHLVYFSSLCIFYSNSRYSWHKVDMERAVKLFFPRYTIVRLGNINWGKNPNTLINFLRDKIRKGEPFQIEDTYRYIVNRAELLHWIGLIPEDWNCEMNIPGERIKVSRLVWNLREEVEKLAEAKRNYPLSQL